MSQSISGFARPLLAAVGLSVTLAVALAACGGGADPVSVNPDGSKLFWKLTIDQGAVTFDSGSTQQIVATPRYFTGAPISGLPAPTYTSLDISKVSVTPSGLITALKPTTGTVAIVASLTVGGVTNVDTALVLITAGHHTLKTFAVRPLSPDTLPSLPFNSNKLLEVVASDSADVPLTNLAVKYATLTPDVVRFYYGSLFGASVGPGTIVATTTSYGVTIADTLNFTVTNPMSGYFSFNGPLGSPYGGGPIDPVVSIIGVGGTITFANSDTVSIDVIFSDSTVMTPATNLHALARFQYPSATRVFNVPGTYWFKAPWGDSARVVVLPN